MLRAGWKRPGGSLWARRRRRYNLGYGLSVRCVGKGCPEASADGERRGRRPQELADRLAVYLREPDEFLRADLTSPLFDRNQQWSAHAKLG